MKMMTADQLRKKHAERRRKRRSIAIQVVLTIVLLVALTHGAIEGRKSLDANPERLEEIIKYKLYR